MHAALLWQPSGVGRRREDRVDRYGKIIRRSPPSWSWAGWVEEGGDFSGSKVSLETPFEVMADGKGLLMRPKTLGEERIRPLHRNIFGVTELVLPSGGPSSFKLVDLGLLNQRRVLDQITDDWESFEQKQRPELPPRGLDLSTLSNHHLVFHTEVASLWLGLDIFKVKTRTKLDDVEYVRETHMHWDPTVTSAQGNPDIEKIIAVSRERQILEAGTGKVIGTIKLNGTNEPEDRSVCQAVTAMVISEAQYMGNEARVDVLGYPVYNIMAIVKKPNGCAERIGLGKIYKYAWKKVVPTREAVILE
jgi:hypothetical protein